MQTFLTEKQRTEILKQDAEAWRSKGCWLILLLPLFGLLLLLMAGGYFLNQAFTFPTNDLVVSEVASPDGTYVAAIVRRNTDSFAPGNLSNERILLRRASEPFQPDREGHIHVEPVYDDIDSGGLELKWQGKRTLLITIGGCWHGVPSKEESGKDFYGVWVKSHSCEYQQ